MGTPTYITISYKLAEQTSGKQKSVFRDTMFTEGRSEVGDMSLNQQVQPTLRHFGIYQCELWQASQTYLGSVARATTVNVVVDFIVPHSGSRTNSSGSSRHRSDRQQRCSV